MGSNFRFVEAKSASFVAVRPGAPGLTLFVAVAPKCIVRGPRLD